MARLAAYYQEDFHYPFAGSGHKQRKSYVVYEEPKNNVFNSYSFNRERIRGLATSEPSLDLPQVRPEAMQRRVYQHQGQVYQNYPYQYENVQNVPHHYFARYEPEVYDNESIFSYNQHDNHHDQRFKSRSRKRFSYAEPNDIHSPELAYMAQNGHRHRTRQSQENLDLQYYDDVHYQPDNNYFMEPISQCQSTPVHFRPESRQDHWQKHPFIHVNANPVFLSPPSPLDSGLSSQSVGSNPSLDAEHSSENLHVMRSGRHSACSCTRLPNCDNRRLNSRDFGEMSPIAYQVSHRSAVPQQRYSKKGTVRSRKHLAEDYDVPTQCESQPRYGKLGLMGEPTDNQQKTVNDVIDNRKQLECQPKDRIRYVHSDDSDVSQQRPANLRRKKSSNNYSRPCVIVINGPDNNKRPPSSSPENQEELSDDKSQGPESPMSVTVSNSDSAPSSLEQDDPPRMEAKPQLKRRQSSAELEIRELEAMYARCNLGDRDLLDRAERRDLPTAHQQNRLLPRSLSSDALCETSRYLHNPYEPVRRAPPLRRSGLPDRVADDMAQRKLQRHPSRRGRHQSNVFENPITYMLCNAHFTPPMRPSEKDVLMLDNPDVELDDLCYRKHYLGKESKQDPEPPFGIPLRPPPTQKVCISDYLHSVPSSAPRPLCHPRGNPDVVRDDMAFRTLRKDEPEREYYDISQIYRHKKRGNQCLN